VTEWPQFARLDFSRLLQSMRYPVILDGRNLYDPNVVAAAGFHYYSVGRPVAEPSPDARPGIELKARSSAAGVGPVAPEGQRTFD